MNGVDTNILSTTIIIAGVIFVALFTFLVITTVKVRKRAQDELSGKEGVYDGPAGEPLWDGTLPQEVNDYTTPRYVYENLFETTTCQPENGRIKGYDYLLPIFTFGKFYKENDIYWLPLSIQVHHAVCDGFHTCRLINELQNILNTHHPT